MWIDCLYMAPIYPWDNIKLSFLVCEITYSFNRIKTIFDTK